MAIESESHGIMITRKEDIAFYRLLVLRGGLTLECQGLHHSRGSVYALVKREFGFKGNKEKVLAQLNAYIEQTKVARAN